MIPLVAVEKVTTPIGEMILSRRGNDYTIRVSGIELMSSMNHRSEDEIGRLACAALAGVAAPRILIGGLGLGYTLRAALDALGPKAKVDISELVPAVVRWNRDIVGGLANHPLADPRVTVIEEDVARVIAGKTHHWDAIILDVDNGPDSVGQHNDALYKRSGLLSARTALVPGGLLAVWSSFESATFTRWLHDAGYESDLRRIRAHGAVHWIWLARVRPPQSTQTPRKPKAPPSSNSRRGAPASRRRR